MSRGAASIASAILVAACGQSQPQAPATTPSVLVTLQQPMRGSRPDVLTAYGSAAPALNGAVTLNMLQPGQVTQLAATPGAAVRAGQLLLVFTADPSSMSAYQQAVSGYSAAQKQRATISQLLSQQLATRDQLTQADKAVSDAAATLDALRRQGANQAVRTFRAPFEGIVTAVSVAQGDRTQPGAPLVTVAKTGGIVVTVGLDPAARARVHAGQSATLERLTGGTPLAGNVLRVRSALNVRTRLVDVDLGFPAGTLMPGEAVRAGIRVGEVAGWLVPHRAVVTANGDPRIYQLANGKATPVKVTVLLATPGGDVVEGPVDPGRRVIVDGAYQVEPGSAVRWVGR